MKAGDRVRMTQQYKQTMEIADLNLRKKFGSAGIGLFDEPSHVQEFGRCIGIVQGPITHDGKTWPEWDVMWLPSRLRYGYLPEHLELIK